MTLFFEFISMVFRGSKGVLHYLQTVLLNFVLLLLFIYLLFFFFVFFYLT